MKILAPIREFDELEMLLGSGAEELYCGVVPREWLANNPGALWLNRRSPVGSGLESLAALRRLRDEAHRHRVPVFVTLNAPSYTESQLPFVLDLATRLSEEGGADALIVSDLNLIALLSERRLAAHLHVSSVAATLNSEAVRFLLNFGPSRVILPRSVTLDEIRELTGQVGREVEIEVFLLNDGCAFEEGFCSTTHHHSVGAFCTNLSEMRAEFEWYGPRFTSRRELWLRRNLADYRDWIWYLNGNGGTASPNGLPYGPCGLCALPDLQAMGVASLKIVGRESSAFRKLASVKMAADIMKRVRAQASKLVVIERARGLRQEPEHCDSGYMCYYRVDS
jgi:putative protease